MSVKEDNDLRFEYIDTLAKTVSDIPWDYSVSIPSNPNLIVKFCAWEGSPWLVANSQGLTISISHSVMHCKMKSWSEDCIMRVPFNLSLISDVFKIKDKVRLEDIMRVYHFSYSNYIDNITGDKFKLLVKPYKKIYKNDENGWTIDMEEVDTYHLIMETDKELFRATDFIIDTLMYASEEERIRKNARVKAGIINHKCIINERNCYAR